MVFFAVQKLVSLIRFHLFILLLFLLLLLLWKTDLKKHWCNLCQRMFCPFSFLGVLWWHLIFKPSSFGVYFYVWWRVCSNFIDLHVAVQLSNNLCRRDCLFFFLFYFIFKLYVIVLVLPNIKMNPPQVYMCSPSWTLLPPPSPFHPSGSSQCQFS